MKIRWVVTYRITSRRRDRNSVMGWIDRVEGINNNNYNTWTPDPERALLFATRIEAQAVVAAIGGNFPGVRARRVP